MVNKAFQLTQFPLRLGFNINIFFNPCLGVFPFFLSSNLLKSTKISSSKPSTRSSTNLIKEANLLKLPFRKMESHNGLSTAHSLTRSSLSSSTPALTPFSIFTQFARNPSTSHPSKSF